MKKIIIYIGLFLSWFLFLQDAVFARDVITIPGTTEIERVSLDERGTGVIAQDIYLLGLSILNIAKRIIMGLFVIFAVYVWVMMIISMGSDEERLSSAKRQIWYFLVALLFINIPGTLYEAFYKDGSTSIGSSIWSTFDDTNVDTGNIFFDLLVFTSTVDVIIVFMQIMIFLAAVVMITIAGIQVMTSRGRDEKMTEAKNKIVYTVLALIFVGIIEVWKRVAFGGSISDGVNLFESLANLALFFAAPIALFFLTLAGYYFITSNGDEERVKKAKSIIINTVLATLILLAAYTFLLDLATII